MTAAERARVTYKFKIANMTQPEVSDIDAREAKKLVQEVYPTAEPHWLVSWQGNQGWTIRNTHSRMWTGFQKTQGNAWKSAAWMLWQLLAFYPKEAPQ